eukprot:CAMPEP_0119519666 /NCGR_PEP_ID=MMETSP1344-20130328/35900_1 /TAXON_ID=236787 /ORGANISM="Florenciella parvula, Strain CCMP2471" /LENGTH=36 /DNA_ID= /DNA_START= /DNA_END= /DNA_ORIENTATION=
MAILQQILMYYPPVGDSWPLSGGHVYLQPPPGMRQS